MTTENREHEEAIRAYQRQDSTPRLFSNGTEIRKRRLKKFAETQEKFAERAGVGLSTLRRAEQGDRIAYRTIEKLAQTLDVDPTKLVEVWED